MTAGLSGFGRSYDPSDGLNHPYNRLSCLQQTKSTPGYKCI